MIFFVQLVIGLMLVVLFFSKTKTLISSTISEITVIVPFKNEASRISGLLKSIKSMIVPEGFNVEYIFVNDHSSDNSDRIIQDHLPSALVVVNEGTGKKMAINTAVDRAQYKFILSWDADIKINENYFEALRLLEECDMWILPVQLTGNSLIQRLGSIEYSWLQIIGISLAKWQTPFLSSGANLLYRKATYLKVDKNRSDYDLPSGDDYFLLKEFRKIDADIKATSQLNLRVTTPGPVSLNELVLQRKRWLQKTKGKTSTAEILLFALQFIFIGSFIWSFFNFHLGFIVFIPIGMKLFNEYLLLQFEKRFKEPLVDFFIVTIHQVWYLFYVLRLVTPTKKKDERWG